MSKITIFTPTYNRAYCLNKGYEALKRQTNKDFIWLIIDDGSTDNTKELVESWIEENNDFQIKYLYKENGGMYTGYNLAIANIDTELSVCVDSDDYLTDNAIEKILNKWELCDQKKYAGIISLDCFEDGTILGDMFPNQKVINLIDLYIGKYDIENKDRKIIVRTDLYKSVAPMNEYSGEKDFNPHLMHLQISKYYDFLIINEPLCVVEYQPDGMSNTIFKQYFRSPKSFRESRLFELSLANTTILFKIKKTIHYISSCRLSHLSCVKDTNYKLLTIFLYPLGVIFSWVVKYKNNALFFQRRKDK